MLAIELTNLDLHPITAVQIAEFPSSWIDVRQVEDDFNFKP